MLRSALVFDLDILEEEERNQMISLPILKVAHSYTANQTNKQTMQSNVHRSGDGCLQLHKFMIQYRPSFMNDLLLVDIPICTMY